MTIVGHLPSLALSARDRLDDTLIGPSREMADVRAWVRQAAPLDATVLIEGETGTGKEVVAQALHELSARRGPLVVVNVADLSPELAEAELFGVVRGAYTGATDRRGRIELAHDGTLYLDEAGDLPRAVQARLLRVLETGRFSRVGEPRERVARFRLILAVQQSPGRLMAEQRWRRDFLFRVGRLHLALPPLSARGGDVLVLANHFLARLGAIPLPLEAHVELLTHVWSGNVRELAHAVERAVFLAGARSVSPCDIVAAAKALLGGVSTSVHEISACDEARWLLELCTAHRWDMRQVAAELGVSRATAYRLLRRAGLEPRARRSIPSAPEQRAASAARLVVSRNLTPG